MEEFLRYVVRNLTSTPPEAIFISRSETARKITFRIGLPQNELGKIIGKQGRTIAAIRNLLSASAVRHGQKVLLQIEE